MNKQPKYKLGDIVKFRELRMLREGIDLEFEELWATTGKVICIVISACGIEYRVNFIHPATKENINWYVMERYLL